MLVLALALVLGNAGWTRAAHDPNAQPSIAGIDNSGQVDAHLYRGAQPDLAAFASLKENLDIAIVVRLNAEGPDVAAEKSQVESLGMKFVYLPWSASSVPADRQIVEFLDLLRDNPSDKIFVHCREGADRTGVMVALYRLDADRWSTAQAVAEMKLYHYHHTLWPQLQRFVESFPAKLATDKNLSQLTLAPAGVSP